MYFYHLVSYERARNILSAVEGHVINGACSNIASVLRNLLLKSCLEESDNIHYLPEPGSVMRTSAARTIQGAEIRFGSWSFAGTNIL